MQRGGFSLFVLAWAILVQPQAGAQEPVQTPAPDQYRQPLFISPHPSLFTIPDAEQVFEREACPAPDFLPPEVYQSQPLESFETKPSKPDEDVEEDSPLQLVQYPEEDSAARDEDPEGHYAEPRWNPFPFLSEKLAALPQTERGLIFKEAAVTGTVLPAGTSDFGITMLDFRSTIYFGQLPILQVMPRFGWHFLNGPAKTDLPPQLYDAGIDTNLYLPLSERWSFLGTVGPNIFTDGQNTGSASFRITGKALAFYQWSETTKISAGFLYLDRANLKALPAGGIFYKPNDFFKAEIFFPKPKIAYRFRYAEDRESWCYLAGEFGGNSWAIRRSYGVDDVVTLRDYRLIAGLEHIAGDQYRWILEAGFVFGRQITYTSGNGDIRPSPTGLMRAGVVF